MGRRGISGRRGRVDRGCGRAARSGSCWRAYPTMPATVIAERIGWTRGITVLKDRVAQLRPVYLPPDPASRTSYRGGRDRAVRSVVPAGRGAGRVRAGADRDAVAGAGDGDGLLAVAVGGADPDPRAADLFAGWWLLICGLGAVPRLLVWDGEGAIGRWRGGRVAADRGDARRSAARLGTKVIVCKPADPEAKGLVERANGYLETSFLPGRALRLTGRLQRPARRVAGAGQHAARAGRWAAPRVTGSPPTGPRC